MLDLSFVREKLDFVRDRLSARAGEYDLAPFLELDAERRRLLRDSEGLKQRKNQASEEVARLKREGGDAAAIIVEMREVGDRIREYDDRLKIVEEQVSVAHLTHLDDDRGRVAPL